MPDATLSAAIRKEAGHPEPCTAEGRARSGNVGNDLSRKQDLFPR